MVIMRTGDWRTDVKSTTRRSQSCPHFPCHAVPTHHETVHVWGLARCAIAVIHRLPGSCHSYMAKAAITANKAPLSVSPNWR